MSNDKQFIDFKKEVEKLKEIDGAEEYAKQLAHLFLGNGLSLQTILLMAIDFGQQHPQWIPVEERLPEHCDCLLYTEPRNIHGPFEGRFRFGFYNYADQRWEIRGEKWDNTIVTHWMPIVPPRKEA